MSQTFDMRKEIILKWPNRMADVLADELERAFQSSNLDLDNLEYCLKGFFDRIEHLRWGLYIDFDEFITTQEEFDLCFPIIKQMMEQTKEYYQYWARPENHYNKHHIDAFNHMLSELSHLRKLYPKTGEEDLVKFEQQILEAMKVGYEKALEKDGISFSNILLDPIFIDLHPCFSCFHNEYFRFLRKRRSLNEVFKSKADFDRCEPYMRAAIEYAKKECPPNNNPSSKFDAFRHRFLEEHMLSILYSRDQYPNQTIKQKIKKFGAILLGVYLGILDRLEKMLRK